MAFGVDWTSKLVCEASGAQKVDNDEAILWFLKMTEGSVMIAVHFPRPHLAQDLGRIRKAQD